MNRRMDWRILKIVLPGFQIQSEILMDFWILQWQWIADSYIFGPGFWLLRVIKIFCLDFGFTAIIEGQIWLINHNESADLHTPIHPPPLKEKILLTNSLGNCVEISLQNLCVDNNGWFSLAAKSESKS